MSLITAAFAVQYFLQKLSIQPYMANPSTQFLQRDPRYFRKGYKRYLKFVRIIWLYQTLFVAFRFVWLSHHWKIFTINHLQQGILYLTSMCGHILLELLHALQIHHHQDIMYLVNQALNFRKQHKTKLNDSYISKRNWLEQLFVYSLSLSISSIAPGIFMIPFAVKFDPHQLVFGTSLLVKSIAGVFYSLAYFNHLLTFISVLTMYIAFLEGMYCLTITLARKQILGCFQNHYISFKKAVLLVQFSNEVFSQFATVLILVGVLLASSCACTILKMHYLLNMVTSVTLLGITFACIAMALGLSYLCNLPLQNLCEFKRHWTGVKFGIENRKMIDACRPTGIRVGSYGTATSILGFYICDDIVHNTATLLLIDIL